MKGKIDSVKVVWWNDLDNSGLFTDTFDSFSYGDAAATLVTPKQIIDELGGLGDGEDELDPLIKELQAIPEGVLVGFDC